MTDKIISEKESQENQESRFNVTSDGKLVEKEDAEPSFSLEFDEDE